MNAAPVLLVEADTGRVLEQQDAGKPWYPASVTKLMTVYVALNAVKEGRMSFDSLLTVSPLAASQQPSKRASSRAPSHAGKTPCGCSW